MTFYIIFAIIFTFLNRDVHPTERAIVNITLVKKLVKNLEGTKLGRTAIEVYEKDVEFPDFIFPPVGNNIEVKFLLSKWSSVTAVNFHTSVPLDAAAVSFMSRIYCDMNDYDGTEVAEFPNHYKMALQKDGWVEVDMQQGQP